MVHSLLYVSASGKWRGGDEREKERERETEREKEREKRDSVAASDSQPEQGTRILVGT